MPEPRFSRREFLGLISASAAMAAGCSNPDRGEIVPFTKRPAGARPGVADLYASTFQEGLSAYGVLVKTREGRPIHVEGNDRHPASNAKTSLRAIADVMGLYDPERLKRPLVGGRPAGWAEAERSHAGPAAPPAAGDSAARTARSGVPSHTLASDLFLLSLFVCAIVDLSVAHLHAAIWPKVTTGLSVAQLVGAVAVMVQRYRGLLGSAMHKLAIAALVLMGVMLYLQSFATSFTTFAIGAGVNPATAPVPLSPAFMATVHRVADGLDLLFGFIGAAIVLRSGEPASQ